MRGMSTIVRIIVAILGGLVILYGLYVTLTGHLAPGGGFVGGVIVMAGITMMVLAFGGERARELMKEHHCQMLEGFGALAFVIIALLGFFAAGSCFFKNFLPTGKVHELTSGGMIPLSNVAIAIKVGAGLTGIFLALVLGCRSAMFRKGK